MKAQHPPHIPSNTLAVTEYFRSLPRSWEGGSGCREEVVAPGRPPAAQLTVHIWRKVQEQELHEVTGRWGFEEGIRISWMES